MPELDRPPTRAETRAAREARARADAADVADDLARRVARVRRDRPGHGPDAVLGVRVWELETVLADRAIAHARITYDLDEAPRPAAEPRPNR